MTLVKMLRNVSVGILFGILALGLLPFLVIFNLAEMLSLAELETTPLFMIIGRFIGPVARKDKTSRPEQQQEQDH